MLFRLVIWLSPYHLCFPPPLSSFFRQFLISFSHKIPLFCSSFSFLFALEDEHGFPTTNYGNDCKTEGTPWINNVLGLLSLPSIFLSHSYLSNYWYLYDLIITFIISVDSTALGRLCSTSMEASILLPPLWPLMYPSSSNCMTFSFNSFFLM